MIQSVIADLENAIKVMDAFKARAANAGDFTALASCADNVYALSLCISRCKEVSWNERIVSLADLKLAYRRKLLLIAQQRYQRMKGLVSDNTVSHVDYETSVMDLAGAIYDEALAEHDTGNESLARTPLREWLANQEI